MMQLVVWLAACAFVLGCASPSFKDRQDAATPEPPDAASEATAGDWREAGAAREVDAGGTPVEAGPVHVAPTGKTGRCVVGVSKIGECTL